MYYGGSVGFAKGSDKGTGGKHALGRQQPTGKPAKSTSKGKATGKHGKDQGKHRGGGDTKGGAAGGLDRWG